MAGSTYGKLFKISTWGESHGKAIGVVIDGCPSGVPLTIEDIQSDLDKRKPGQSPYATPRKEADKVEILSGIFEGKTTGTPISLIVHNTNQKSKDYSNIAKVYRPGHADYAFDCKYGFRDYRGGGRSSGRETIGRVAAGAIAKKILSEMGISITAYVQSIGPISIESFDKKEIYNNFLCLPDASKVKAAEEYLISVKDDDNSSGAMIECIIDGVPAGLGEPVFDKLDANLAKAIMSIGSIKSVEIGAGKDVAAKTGIENNDFYKFENNTILKETNNAGGITGGISDGSQIFLRAASKPTPSIHKTQRSVNKDGSNVEINIEGRHDPIIAPRAVIVVEAMVALILTDMLLLNMHSKMSNILKVYR